MEESNIKHNSLIESIYNASPYKKVIDYLKQNFNFLSDFVITEREICSILNATYFDYNSFYKEFNSYKEFRNLTLQKNPYDGRVFHILRNGVPIPEKYSRDVMRDLASNNYDTRSLKHIFDFWEKIEKAVSENKDVVYNNVPLKSGEGKLNQSANYTTLNPTAVSMDGSYGSHVFKDRETGRFYSVPTYDNYGHDSDA